MSQVMEYIPAIKLTRKERFLRGFERNLSIAKYHLVTMFDRLPFVTPLNINTISRRIDKNAERPTDLRKLLMKARDKVALIPVSAAHTHRKAAQLRTSSDIFMNNVAKEAGFDPYNVSRSGHAGGQGCRFYYHEKDLAYDYVCDKPTENSCFIFCDVDYYADMNKWMKLFRPIIMYTFVPETCAGNYEEYAFQITDNRVVYNVSGGATYSHPLWEYSGDTVSVVDNTGCLCVFAIEQQKLPDPNRRIIHLLPYAKIQGPWWRARFTPNPLKRKVMTDKGTNRLFDPVSDKVSMAPSGSWHSVELQGRTLAAIQHRLKTKEAPPVCADVERILRASGDRDFACKSPVLFGMIETDAFVPNVVRTTTLGAHYTPIGPLTTEDGNPSGRVIGNQLLSTPAVFPTRGYNTDCATVKGRIEGVANTVRPGRKYERYAEEFVNLVVPKAGEGGPVTVDEVRRAQNGPQQRARFQQAKDIMATNSVNRLSAFVKAEAYGTTNDPRNITTMGTETTVLMTCFTTAFKNEVMKKFKWYGPGKTPTQTCKRLQHLATFGRLISTDYSRFDGSISEFLVKQVIKPCYMRWCAEQYRPELQHWFDQVYRKIGMTQFGVEFKPGYGTRSGSPITTDGNTLVGGYVPYCTFRDLGYSSQEAFELIGLICSDDGITPEYTEEVPPALEITAKELGLTMKSVVVEQGDPVPYLGRYFVDPEVMTDSFQDPLRTIGKLHLTANKQVTEAQALVNKACGYWNTDAKTPIIGTWAKKVRETHGVKVKGALREEQWKCSNAWPQTDPEAIVVAMAGLLDMTVPELLALDKLVSDSALDQLPILIENVVAEKLPSIKGDVVVEPGPSGIQTYSDNVRPTSQDDNSGSKATFAAHPRPNGTGNPGANARVCPPQHGRNAQRGAAPNRGNPRGLQRGRGANVRRGNLPNRRGSDGRGQRQAQGQAPG